MRYDIRLHRTTGDNDDDGCQLHVQLQQQADEDQLTVSVSTPDSKTRSSVTSTTDDDVDAALDDLQMTLTGDEADGKPAAMLKKCPELRGYHLVYK